MRFCKKCGIELSEYCEDCVGELLSKAIEKANKEKQKNAKKGVIVYDDDPMYKAIMERRDLEARKLTEPLVEE